CVLISTHTLSTLSSPLSLHDALPICRRQPVPQPVLYGLLASHHLRAPLHPERHPDAHPLRALARRNGHRRGGAHGGRTGVTDLRSEEHTSELQSRENLVCRLLLEKKK